jgi:hypothetical protein
MGTAVMNGLLAQPVIKYKIKTARQSNENLGQLAMRMAGAFSATWDIIEVVNASNIEGHMAPPFGKTQIAPIIIDRWHIDPMAAIKRAFHPWRLACPQGIRRFAIWNHDTIMPLQLVFRLHSNLHA